MKAFAIATVIVLIVLLLDLSYNIRALREDVAQLPQVETPTSSTQPSVRRQTLKGMADNEAIVTLLKAELEAQLAENQLALIAQLEKERELSAAAQQEAIAEYFASSDFEDRLWGIVNGFILDFLHPENQALIEKQIQEQAQAYQEEQDRKFPERRITNNLRMIASAGQQYILEEGVSSVNYSQLVGDYFRAFDSVAGERYDNITISENGGTIRATTADGKVVEFSY